MRVGAVARRALSLVLVLPAFGPATISTRAQTSGQEALPPAAPVISLWYRGTPPGMPRREDLDAIRAAGFTGVTWPSREAAGAAALARLAESTPLHVTLRIAPVPVTASTARQKNATVDVAPGPRGERVAALAWRALAHGASVVSIDPGVASGTGLDAGATAPPWLAPVQQVSRTLASASQLFTEARSVANVPTDPVLADALELRMLEDARSWILVATNASGARARAVARLPPGIPNALWVNLIDGGLLSMIAEPLGARWNVDLPPWAARVYVVNKGIRFPS